MYPGHLPAVRRPCWHAGQVAHSRGRSGLGTTAGRRYHPALGPSRAARCGAARRVPGLDLPALSSRHARGGGRSLHRTAVLVSRSAVGAGARDRPGVLETWGGYAGEAYGTGPELVIAMTEA